MRQRLEHTDGKEKYDGVHIDEPKCCHVQACESPRDRNAAILLVRKVSPP